MFKIGQIIKIKTFDRLNWVLAWQVQDVTKINSVPAYSKVCFLDSGVVGMVVNVVNRYPSKNFKVIMPEQNSYCVYFFDSKIVCEIGSEDVEEY
jgi:hypothetical protein